MPLSHPPSRIMASSPPSILFSAHPKTRVFFQSAVNTYYLCPDCLRSCEARYCSGRTVLSHEMCEVHRYLLESKANSNGTPFDLDDLTYFRKALLDGTLKNDFKVRQAYLKAQEKTDRRRPNHLWRGAAVPPAPRPPPLLDTGDGHHDENAVSTDTPASGSPSRKVNDSHNSLESSMWAHDSRRPSEAVSTASSSTTSTATTASQSPSNSSHRSTISVPEELSTTFPGPRITYAHDPRAHCLSSPQPHFLLLPSSLLRALTTAKLHRLRELRTRYDSCWGQDGDLKVEHKKLLEEVSVVGIGRGLFFKRCNGEWVNGIGTGVGELSDRIDGEVLDEAKVLRLWAEIRLDARMTALDARGTEREALSSKKRDSMNSLGSISDSNSDSLDESVSATPSASISDSTSSSTSASSPAEESEKDRFEAAHRHQDEHSDPQPPLADSSIKTKIPLSLLQARESRVHQGITTEEDLILTCWAMNSQF